MIGTRRNVIIEDGPTIEADEIVVATHAPVQSKLAMHDKQSPYRTFVIGVDVPRGSVKSALYYDTLKPYHYVRVYRDRGHGSKGDLLIVDLGLHLSWIALRSPRNSRRPAIEDLKPVPKKR